MEFNSSHSAVSGRGVASLDFRNVGLIVYGRDSASGGGIGMILTSERPW
jgi:hypothetical protein